MTAENKIVTLKQIDTKEIGKALIERVKQAQSIVTRIVESISVCEEGIERYEKTITFYREKLAAIEAGEFEVSKWRGEITFNDAKLNEWK